VDEGTEKYNPTEEMRQLNSALEIEFNNRMLEQFAINRTALEDAAKRCEGVEGVDYAVYVDEFGKEFRFPRLTDAQVERFIEYIKDGRHLLKGDL